MKSGGKRGRKGGGRNEREKRQGIVHVRHELNLVCFLLVGFSETSRETRCKIGIKNAVGKGQAKCYFSGNMFYFPGPSMSGALLTRHRVALQFYFPSSSFK